MKTKTYEINGTCRDLLGLLFVNRTPNAVIIDAQVGADFLTVIFRDVVLGTCTCTRVVLEYHFKVLVLVLVLVT